MDIGSWRSVLCIACSAAVAFLAACQPGGSGSRAESNAPPAHDSPAVRREPAAQNDYFSREMDDMAREDARSTRVQPPATQRFSGRAAPQPMQSPGPGPIYPSRDR